MQLPHERGVAGWLDNGATWTPSQTDGTARGTHRRLARGINTLQYGWNHEGQHRMTLDTQRQPET